MIAAIGDNDLATFLHEEQAPRLVELRTSCTIGTKASHAFAVRHAQHVHAVVFLVADEQLALRRNARCDWAANSAVRAQYGNGSKHRRGFLTVRIKHNNMIFSAVANEQLIFMDADSCGLGECRRANGSQMFATHCKDLCESRIREGVELLKTCEDKNGGCVVMVAQTRPERTERTDREQTCTRPTSYSAW